MNICLHFAAFIGRLNPYQFKKCHEVYMKFPFTIVRMLYVDRWRRRRQKAFLNIGCSQTFSIYLFLGFAGVSYGRFVAVCFWFNLSMYVQNRW